jgi:hypothetical protein
MHSLRWWEKREVEQRLARELHGEWEALRRANAHFRDAVLSVDNVPPDSNVMVAQAYRQSVRAHAAWKVAFDRWKGFVCDGTIPDDWP